MADMRARSLFTMVLLVTALTSQALVQAPPAPAATAPVAKPFRHGQHVPQEWCKAKVLEVYRDCRGCHRFTAQNLVSAPQQHCDECHVRGLERAPGAQDMQRFRSRTGEAFRHHTHAMLECRQCHGEKSIEELKKNKDGPEFQFDDFAIRTGPGQCANCHEQGRATFEAFRFFKGAQDDEDLAKKVGLPGKFVPPTSATFEAYQKKLVEVFAGPTGGINTHPLPVGGYFDHGDHCGVAEVGGSVVLGALLQCVDCHTNIEKATAREVGTGKIPTENCGSCHKTERAAARAAVAATKPSRTLWSLGTFAHADHYAFRADRQRREPRVCNEEAFTCIENGCDACHKSDAKALGRPDSDFPFRAGNSKYRYVDCKYCHDVAGWQTGETPAAPLHASTGASGWAPCEKCHVFGQPKMAEVRVMSPVERLSGRTFEFPANVHPDITTSGVTRSGQEGRAALQECKDCHRARVPKLDTRLQKKVFRHDTHLPAVPLPKDCSTCHPRAATAKDSGELAGSGFRTYTLVGCSNCHWGEVVGEERVAGETPEKRTPQKKMCVEFPHGPHVTAAKLSCLQCHAPAAEGRQIETLPGALRCNQCHDHKAGQAGEPKYEGLFDGGAASCGRCHREAQTDNAPMVCVVPPIGGTDPRYAVEPTTFGGFADAQFHPLGVECTECHKANAKRTLDEPPTKSKDRLVEVLTRVGDEARLFATKKVSVHAAGGQKEPAQCLRCHWQPVGIWEAAVNYSVMPGEDRNLRLQPGSKPTRDKFGNDSKGYPGNGADG